MSKLSDAEVIVMEIVAEFMGKDQDKSIGSYFRNTAGSRTFRRGKSFLRTSWLCCIAEPADDFDFAA